MSDAGFSWPGIASAIAAWVALLMSGGSLWMSRRAVRIAERQEKRREPLLKPYYRDGFYQPDADGGRVYAFLLTVSNRSDSNNTIIELELRITYATPEGVEATLKVRAEPRARFDLDPSSHISQSRSGSMDTRQPWAGAILLDAVTS